MLLILHILVALAGLGLVSYNLVNPSHKKQQYSYLALLGTIVSGTVLTLSAHAPLVSACISGLIYTSVVSLCLYISHKRLNSTE